MSRHAILVVLAASHLGLVICGAARVQPIARPARLALGVETYRAWTGANNAYGFYAPAVASEWRTQFEICRTVTKRCFRADEERPTREAVLLLSTIDGMFVDADLRELLAASWAAAQLARFPTADVVLVKSQMYVLPTMNNHRQGQRPQWRTAHVFAFRRAPHPGS